MTPATRALLLRLHGAAAAGPVLAAAIALLRRELQGLKHTNEYATLAGTEVYVYAWMDSGADVGNDTIDTLHAALSGSFASAFTLDRLELQRDFAGASAGAPAPRFYVVETDPAEGSEEEMFRWYDSEHMPGLAAVPGCARAMRLLNRDGGPRAHACYALANAEVTSTPAWLAVRATPWSARVRPNFRNTRRTMFRAL
jgi:hypothetical protein